MCDPIENIECDNSLINQITHRACNHGPSREIWKISAWEVASPSCDSASGGPAGRISRFYNLL